MVVGNGRGLSGHRTPVPVGEGCFDFSLQEFPLVRLVSPQVARQQSVDVSSFFAGIDQALERRRPFIVLHDARGQPPVDSARKLAFLDMVEQRRGDVDASMIAYAGLVQSPLERGMGTAYIWSVRLRRPIRLFEREEDALRWLGESLHACRGVGPERTLRVRG